MDSLEKLLLSIRQCTLCEPEIEANPVLSISNTAKILIIGQAPGTKVHITGIPWNDPSGEKLREWMSVDKETFYDSSKISIVPMGFCYPGKGKTGDLPPRKECQKWHIDLAPYISNIDLTILIGQYAQSYYLPNKPRTLTETVRNFADYLPNNFPLPHPSPRNRIWLKQNEWFEKSVIPVLKSKISDILS